jgi:hypothetical protein
MHTCTHTHTYNNTHAYVRLHTGVHLTFSFCDKPQPTQVNTWPKKRYIARHAREHRGLGYAAKIYLSQPREHISRALYTTIEPQTCLVMLVRHLPRCTFSEGPWSRGKKPSTHRTRRTSTRMLKSCKCAERLHVRRCLNKGHNAQKSTIPHART